ncbi:DUF4249 domain-containing protein [Mangrovimonas sp. ST2L15]|uniref:DUF4249 domain-containing protein n=1 Tax=Mangrovimonas sp. ST2L15 TaxID=1645916 RepID=UPI0006B544A7|nr:DUF4249 domain-containing protein [Mangrovimonas sp. ST2L15]
MMKKILYILLSGFITLVSCEDVIDVDVPTAATRLVIEASLDWEKGTAGNEQSIELRLSTPYFDTTSNSDVTGASVVVENLDSGETFMFDDMNDGSYTTSSFVPVIGNTYELTVVYQGETYTATEVMTPVAEISNITQSVEGGFDDELLEVNVYFTDPADEENYYLFRYQADYETYASLYDLSDEFVNGNEIHDFYEKQDDEDNGERPFQAGDVVAVDLYGISEAYYNYIRILIEQSSSQGDPFSSLAAQVKGNCINETQPANYAFGYFRVTEVDKRSYTVE